MNYIFIAILAYFIFAIESAINKFLLNKALPNPIAFGFYTGLLSFFVIIFIPFGFSLLSAYWLVVTLLAGAVFLAALIFFFKGIYQDEVSRLVAAVGGLTPVFILLLSFIFLGERLNQKELLAFALLIGGAVLISFRAGRGYKLSGLTIAGLASFLFAIALVMAKYVFLHQPFFNGFIWMRLGSFLAAFFLLIPRRNRQLIFRAGRAVGAKNSFLLVGSKGLAGFGFILLNYAIASGSVALVNAMEGIKFAFLFLLMMVFSWRFPHLLKEEIGSKVLVQKISAIFLISLGLIVLAV